VPKPAPKPVVKPAAQRVRRLVDKREVEARQRESRRRAWLAEVAAAVVAEVASRRRVANWLRGQSRDARRMRGRLAEALRVAGREVALEFLSTFQEERCGFCRPLSTGEVLRIYPAAGGYAFSVRDGRTLYTSNQTFRTRAAVARYLLRQIGLMLRDDGIDLLAPCRPPGRMDRQH
jgi:hypothetical protein